VNFTRIKNPGLYYYLYPVIFLMDYLKIFIFLLSICLKQRIKIILVENTYAAVLAGILKKLCLCEKMVYLPGDWLAGSKTKKGVLSHVGGNIVFPLFDYCACRLSDLTLNCTEMISKSRYEYWGRKIAKKELLFRVRLTIKQNKPSAADARNIAFMGGVRSDSGLELVIRSLNKIKGAQEICLKLIGPRNERSLVLERFAHECGADSKVMFSGFVDRQDLKSVLADCFCGVNLITSKDSYSTKTLPAKIFDYLQYLLPVIVTENSGWIADVVRTHELGEVVVPNEESFQRAVERIYQNQTRYRNNIVKYINSFQGSSLKEVLASL